jgi:hypothetical protein
MKIPAPIEPEVFLKSVLSLTRPFNLMRSGPNDGTKLDRENELGIVIGREVWRNFPILPTLKARCQDGGGGSSLVSACSLR